MFMLLPDLLTLRIVMILAKVESIYPSFRLQDERIIKRPGRPRLYRPLTNNGHPLIESTLTRNSNAGE